MAKNNVLTNSRIRRNVVLTDYFQLDPSVTSLLDLDTHSHYEEYQRTNGMLMGLDPSTGYVKPAWKYTDVATFASQFVGVLSAFTEPKEAQPSLTLPRPKDGKVAIVTLGGGVEHELGAAGAVWPHAQIVPYLDTVPTTDVVHPFKVSVLNQYGPAVSSQTLGFAKQGKVGETVSYVQWNVHSRTQYAGVTSSDDYFTNFDLPIGGTPADREEIVFVATGPARLASFVALLNDTGTSTDVDFDLKVNGASVLSAAVNITHSDADGTVKSGTISTPTLAADDIVSIECDQTSTTGASGPFARVTIEQ